MTRFARGKSTHRRVAGDSSSWTDLKSTPAKEEGAGFDRRRESKDKVTSLTSNGDAGAEGKQNENKGKNFKKGGGGKTFGGGGPKNKNRRSGGGGGGGGGGMGREEESANFTPLGGKDRNVKGQGQTKVVKIFGNFWVGDEDARRLQGLVKQMKAQGLSRKEILDALQNERRKAEKAAKRRRDKICFNCRQFGHVLADCPKENDGAGGEAKSVGGEGEICFKCGSTEHTSRNCKKKTDKFEFAKCFVCQQSGHIARQCPNNTKGIYPAGGCCDECGSTAHLKKDCPDLVGADDSAGNEDSIVARITDPFVSPEAEDFSLPTESPSVDDNEPPSSAFSYAKKPKSNKNKAKLGKRKFDENPVSISQSTAPSETEVKSISNTPTPKKRKVVKF